MTSLSPANLTSHQMLSVSDNSVGPFTVNNINGANYNQNPAMLPSNKILIPPHASAGTKSNCAAAAGKFVRYKSLSGGNKISTNSKMKGGNKLSTAPQHCDSANHRHAAFGTYNNGDVKRPLAIKGGKRHRHTMKKRKSMRKHKKHAKRHHKRSRKMHKKHKKHTRKHKRHHKKHSRKHKKHTRKHKRHSRRHHRQMRGGKQPFSNVPMSFGYSANLKHLKPSMSAIANPVPINSYDNCGKVSRS